MISSRMFAWSALMTFLIFGCSQPGGQIPVTAGNTDTTTVTVPAQPIVLDISNAVGLALTKDTTVAPRTVSRTAMSVPRSNLQKVDSVGNLTDALSSGSALISKFMIAPNGKLYVLFSTPTKLAPTDLSPCLLAEVDPSTGKPTAIDTTLTSISWESSYANNPPIQFDSDGSIYYQGSSASTTVLRRYRNGVTADLINDNIWLKDFVVNADGSVVMLGLTTSSQTYWVRLLTKSGGLSNLFSNKLAGFLMKFSDQNVYIGVGDTTPAGVYRFMAQTTKAIDPNPWISDSASSLIPANDTTGTGLTFGATDSRGFLVTSNSKVYAQALRYNGSGNFLTLVQLYPGLAFPTISLAAISSSRAVLSDLILTGTDISGNNKLLLYDTSTGGEQNLLPNRNIEVYHANFVASTNRIMFDGLDFDTNSIVIGQVLLGGGGVSTVSLGSGAGAKLEDFQTF